MRKAWKIIISVLVCITALASMIALIPIEKDRQLEKEYGALYTNSKTNEKAKYILDNYNDFPAELIDLYYISPEIYEDFVYEYPKYKDNYKTMSYSEEELYSEGIPKLYMADKRWCYETIGGSYIYMGGCAAVSLTMASLYLFHDPSVTPRTVAQLAEDNDCIGLFGGIDALKLKTVAEKLGFRVTEYSYYADGEKTGTVDINDIKNIIDSGDVCLVGAQGEIFGGHALIVSGYDENGLYVNDPASEERSQKCWSFDEVEPEILFIWDLGTEN